jgi:hypothetical protein
VPEKEKLPAEFTEVMRKAASAEEMARLSEVFEVGKIFMFRRFHGWLQKQAQMKSEDMEGLLPEEVCKALLKAMDEVGLDPCSLKSFVEGIREDAAEALREFYDWAKATNEFATMEQWCVFSEGVARGTVRRSADGTRYESLKDSQAEACATKNEGGQVK